MKTLEKDLWQKVKKALPVTPLLHYQRMELSEASGIPDLNICWKGFDVWVELKIFDHSGNKVDFRPEQVSWIHKRVEAGGFVYILAYDNKANISLVVDGYEVFEFAQKGLKGTMKSQAFSKVQGAVDYILFTCADL